MPILIRSTLYPTGLSTRDDDSLIVFENVATTKRFLSYFVLIRNCSGCKRLFSIFIKLRLPS